MKISIVFPSVLYREGPAGVTKLIQGIENIGLDELNMFDHVVMGYPTATRRAPVYSPQMPIMEAFTLLAYAAGVTTKIGLGTGVLVLPQRHPTLVAKQVSTLDTLSNGRIRLGVGIGWQRSEYEALGEDFKTRGPRMNEAIEILRAYWSDEHVNYQGDYYQLDEIALEPKPPQGRNIPIWIGGTKPSALKRVVTHGDGWMAMNAPGDPPLEDRIGRLHAYADELDRDPATIGMQMSLSPDAIDKDARKRFYAEPELILARCLELKALGFDHVNIDCVPIFQQGFRTSETMLEHLDAIYRTLKAELP